MLRIATFFIAISIAFNAFGTSIDTLSNHEMVGGLKEALIQGSSTAVLRLGRENGFLENPEVKIPLPENLKRAEKAMRAFGMGKQVDELIVSMNRAAEQAVPEAKALLLNAVKKMSVQDAKKILTGSDTAATEYFRGHTEVPLTQKFLPIVKKVTERVGLAERYNSFAKKAVKMGLLESKQSTIEDYVTTKALEGLYLMIAEEEKAIRSNPVERSGSYIRKVFGALR